MSFLRGLLWFLFAIVLIAVAMYVTGNFELADRLTGLFLVIQPWLPITLDFDQFLVALTVLSFLVVALVLSGCAAILMVLGERLAVAHQRQLGQSAASKREIEHVKDERQRQYEHLTKASQELARDLDKRVLIQRVVEVASQLTSVPEANSVVSCWLLNLQTDAFQFEFGRYCDEQMFTKTSVGPAELPFAHVAETKKPWLLSEWTEEVPFIRSEKRPALQALSGMIVVPLLIEGRISGVVIVFCHPDVIKSYEEQRRFYEAVWGELTLATATAIRGELAIFDRLTSVYNRGYVIERLKQEIERANRFQSPLSLLMIDIDNFKAVNDTLGHPQGDAVLKIIAKLVKKEVRAVDIVGRYGGEEFVIILPETGYGEEAGTASGALLVGERIRKAVEEEFVGLQKPLNVTVSVGLTVRRFPQDRHVDHQELVRLADEQLYRAKTAGKNRVCFVAPAQTTQEVS